ncbi:Surface antigen domain containing protein [Rhabdaerophilaceae bacterium]
MASRNHCARVDLVFLVLVGALMVGGCSVTMPLTGMTGEEDVTGSIAPQRPAFPVSLDDEDWRRINSALSLAVDPQGAGLPVNWDNPGSKRRGKIAPNGIFTLVGETVCRPFKALIVDVGARESEHEGQACRTGPGEWAMRDVKPVGLMGQAASAEQALPKRSLPMALGERR